MNHKSCIAAVAIAAAGLQGCATMSAPERQAKLQQFRETIPVCEGDADCKAKWEAAQLWVVHNSRLFRAAALAEARAAELTAEAR